MATSGQFQKQYASPPARTYLTTNLAQRRPVPRPKPIPQPVPQPDVQAKDDRDSSTSQPRYPNLIWNPTRYGVQPKLTVGAPNDQYEQEADRVADQVMSMPDSNLQQPVQREATLPEDEELQTKPIAASITPLVQREDMPEDEELQTKTSGNLDIQREDNLEEEEIQMKSLEHSSIQREDNLEEEEIQTKSSLQRSPDGGLQAESWIESRLNSSKGGGSPLPDEVRSYMEPRFGADFSQVRVHTDSEAVQMNRDLNAQAFTHKQDVYFGAGKTPGKDALTAHELTHVVQQTEAAKTEFIQNLPNTQQKCSECEKEDTRVQRSEMTSNPPGANIEEDSEQICPNEEIFSTVETNSLANQAFTAGLSPNTVTGDKGNSKKHVSIAESIKIFEQKVDVKSAPKGYNLKNENISTGGQFFWSLQMDSAIQNELNRIQEADPEGASDFVLKAREARKPILYGRNKEAAPLLSELDSIAKNSLSLQKPYMLALLRDYSVQGATLETLLWGALNSRPDDVLPQISHIASLRTLQVLRNFDKISCGFHALKVAERLKQKGGITARNPSAKPFSATLASGGGIRDRRPVFAPASAFEPAATAAVREDSIYHLGDHIFQTGVSSAVAKMQSALDDGLLVHARVLSGVGYGTDPYVPPEPNAKPFTLGAPPEEHSLLIIGYDDNVFVFHDPDAYASELFGSGFGLLFYDSIDDRLSTAIAPSEFPINAQGYHRRKDKRYQVISLGTI